MQTATTIIRTAAMAAALAMGITTAMAKPAFSCGGFALLGGAQLLCSHIDSQAPAQTCTFSWALMATNTGLTVVTGSFLLAPGISNDAVYQGSGFSYALSNPIVLCQGRKSAGAK